jgi:hypothetical protein
MAQRGECPCCTADHKAFDFWVGNWEVTDANGQEAGQNTIEKVLDSCILKENWTSSNPNFKGSSTNFYNSSTKQWEQLWIDNSGSHLKLYGNRTDNQMILSSDPVTRPDGKEYIDRVTWTLNEDGSVRQLWEVIQGDSVTNVAFDGLYRRVGKD